MRIAFRVDASIEIGTGHVMRCLTLAHALARHGAVCKFICRAHEGNLIEYIRAEGFQVEVLRLEINDESYVNDLAHSNWLGAGQMQDVKACIPSLNDFQPDWLVVDHYGLDARWEGELAPYCNGLMVIDDLADRPHLCNLLLDQTFGREQVDYSFHVPAKSILLCGSEYALLRPEFSALRSYSLQRRETPALTKILINMGGVDKDNFTCSVLHSLKGSSVPSDSSITIVMGSGAPWLKDVQRQSQQLPWATEVMVGVKNMAQIMADCDLAFGAAGSSAWERCCLGVPSIIFVLANNQRKIGQQLSRVGAALVVSGEYLMEQRTEEFINQLVADCAEMTNMTKIAKTLVDGRGAEHIAMKMMA
jgi:UDP-2,4-diacetamido-2,4,6-trideoxy-beta-L-altropyranose hydrolase